VRLVFLIAKTVHGGLYRLSGGRIGAHVAGLPVLLLTTTGRSSGKRRTVPLSYLEDGEAQVVIGSKGGAPRHPDWYLNLEANPEVEVQVGRAREQRQARRATPEEAELLWPLVLARAPGYARYRAKTTREIPLVLLERR
jgi:deazaflavin-dependent oxidoreductase (nitroreductase family)